MTFKLFNTLGRKKGTFKPLHKNWVGIYSCGPTVYHYAHIGNMRSHVTADILKRALIYNGYKVRHIINITDVGHLTSGEDEGEDKIEAQAHREQKSVQDIVSFYTSAFEDDLDLLNIITKDVKFPRATKFIKEQISLIKILEKKGYAYKTSDGIYFDTSKYKNYSRLAKMDIRGLREGARIGVNNEKRNSTDFALWKFSLKNSKRVQEWESPWGVGFPGWHIECSAMSMKFLGKHFDIHTGGIDLVPVHHSNEIAQSEAVTGEKFVNYWVHNEFINLKDEKMSKSTGSILTLTDLKTEGVGASAYRYWLLTAHYRSPVAFSLEAVRGAQVALLRIIALLTEAPTGGSPEKKYMKKFLAYVNDDLDTPQIIALIWMLLKDEKVSPRNKLATINEFDDVLGINFKGLMKDAKQDLQFSVPLNIQDLIKERTLARNNKDWAKADELRIKIYALGYDIKDSEKDSSVTKVK